MRILWKARNPLPHLAFRAEKSKKSCCFFVSEIVERGKRDDMLFRDKNQL